MSVCKLQVTKISSTSDQCSCCPEVVLVSSQVCHLTSDLSGFLRTVVGFLSEVIEHPCWLRKNTGNPGPDPHPPTGLRAPADLHTSPLEPVLTVVLAVSPAQPRHGPRWRAADSGRAPAAGSWAGPGLEGGAALPGNPKPEDTVHPQGGARVGGGVCA